MNVLPLIYDETRKRCNILVFNSEQAKACATRIAYEEAGRGRKHPVFRFYDAEGDYICEVRYGSGTANALQRGLWTNTKTGLKYFPSVTNGWIDYSHNHILVKLFSHALLATSKGHEAALINRNYSASWGARASRPHPSASRRRNFPLHLNSYNKSQGRH
jgi:hypothetical protein